MTDSRSGAAALAAWRLDAKKSQTECAEILKVRQATWSEWEAGHRSPRIKHALAIAKLSGGKVPVTVWADVEPGDLPTEAGDAIAPTFQAGNSTSTRGGSNAA